jgi:import receptor subunit TOM22
MKNCKESLIDSFDRLTFFSCGLMIESIFSLVYLIKCFNQESNLILVPDAPDQVVQSISDDEDEEDDEDDFDDESLFERLTGLSEMFPKGMTSAIGASASGTVSGVKWCYGASRYLTWIIFSSATIMFLPIMIETERIGVEEAQKQQQRQILLGPGAAMSGGGNAQANAPLPTAPA